MTSQLIDDSLLATGDGLLTESVARSDLRADEAFELELGPNYLRRQPGPADG